jgi:4-carboxymuconolactone decarboxylase
MARLPDPLSTLSPDARRVYDKITAKRGQMKGGPFASLMHHPALAEKVGDLGEYLRFGGTLPGDVREMAILITARSVNQAYEWVAHARIARTEKLPDDVIERIRTRGDLSTVPAR